MKQLNNIVDKVCEICCGPILEDELYINIPNSNMYAHVECCLDEISFDGEITLDSLRNRNSKYIENE